MQFFHDHILSIVLFTPLAGLVLLLFIPGENKNAVRWWGNIAMFAGFLVSLPLAFWFAGEAPDQQFKFIERHDWITSIGAQYFLGIDGISFLLIMLTTVLGFLSVLSSWTAIQERAKEYYAMFLLLQTGMLGVFMALDFFLFYVFWEVMLVPMYFIIGVWGGPRKLYAAIKFFLYTLAGSVLMLLGILALYFRYQTDTGTYTFNVLALIQHTWPENLQFWVFWAFMIGFAIKVPMFPFHTWLPDAHVEAPTAGSVILAGVLLKMGTYGFVRFSLPLLPQASSNPKIVRVMVVLSLIAIIYGALVSMMQRDMKKLIAYSSVSHLGFCTLGIFALEPPRPLRQHPPADQSRDFNGSAVLDCRPHLRTAAHARDQGTRRTVQRYAGVCHALHDCDALFHRLALIERLYWRVHHPAGRVRGELALGSLGGAGNRPGSRLYALALSADHVRHLRQSQEPGAEGPESPRDHDPGAAGNLGLLDRALPETIFQGVGETGGGDRAARQSEVLRAGNRYGAARHFPCVARAG